MRNTALAFDIKNPPLRTIFPLEYPIFSLMSCLVLSSFHYTVYPSNLAVHIKVVILIAEPHRIYLCVCVCGVVCCELCII